MADLAAAKISPRIDNGIIKWYSGDTFEIQITFELEDQDGETIHISQSDIITIKFKNRKNEVVKTFTATNITSDTVTMTFDSATSALFPRGVYKYTAVYEGERIVTLIKDSPCEVA